MNLILVLGDQLSPRLSALAAGDPARDVVVLAEVLAEGTSVPHHPQKIALILTAMRKFAARLRADGWTVAYSRLDDPDNSQSIGGEILRRATETGAAGVIATEPGEWRLRAALSDLPILVSFRPDDRFLCPPADFAAWAKGRKVLRMEHFYRDMRRRTGLLMEGDQPAGGQWNYDADNRKPPPSLIFHDGPPPVAPDAITSEVLDLVERSYPDHFGRLRPFAFATDATGAEAQFAHWLRAGLPHFGDWQDAMLVGRPWMYHSVISLYLNLGLLDPLDLCQRVEAEWRAGRVPINAAEGFIRQIIGWREYVRGIWALAGPDYLTRNALGAHRALPPLYWGASTQMACMAAVVGQTRDLAYAHHIQRLMITGNFALLAGLDPAQVQAWYLAVYADAFEWVEVPNVVGMALHADGGMMASKPYAASGAYIDRMSDYCGTCAYRVADKTGDRACPFNLLYWDFVARHADRFRANPRMAQIVRGWERMDPARQDAIRIGAARFLARLDAGETV